MPYVSKCRQRGQSCGFFDLVLVEYNETHCRLNGNTYEISFSIQGRRPPGRSSRHNYKVEVIEQGRLSSGKSSLAQFAQRTKQNFLPGYSKETGTIDSGGDGQITFLVKRTNVALSGQRGIVVNCRFSHGTDSNSNTWCDRHRVSLVLTVV